MIIARRRWGVKVRERAYRTGVVSRTARAIMIVRIYTGGGDGMWERCALSRCAYVSPRTGMLRLRPQNDGWQRRSVRSEIRHLLPQRSLDFARDDGWLTSTQTPWEASPKLATRANSTKYGAANGAVFTSLVLVYTHSGWQRAPCWEESGHRLQFHARYPAVRLVGNHARCDFDQVIDHAFGQVGRDVRLAGNDDDVTEPHDGERQGVGCESPGLGTGDRH